MRRKDRLKIALIGPCPPPYGGVSVHVQRLWAFLLSNRIQCTVYNLSPYLKKGRNVINIRKIKNLPHILNPKGSIIHIHNSGINLKEIMIFSLLSKFRGRELIMTFHSLRDDVEHFNLLKKMILRVFMGLISHYVAVGPQIKNKLLFLNVNSNKISVIPAFLPPTIKQRDISEIPQEIWDFIENHNPVISANAFRIKFYNNQDLYGIDMCVDLCANLMIAHPQIGLVFCLPNIGDYGYFNKMKQQIVEKGIENNFLFVRRPYQFYPILMKSDLFVRPTNTDGDAVSIREALHFKIPAVASDIVPRPEGSVTFKNRHIDDFILKVKDILDNYEWYKKRLESVKLEDNFEKIVGVYQKLISSESRHLQKKQPEMKGMMHLLLITSDFYTYCCLMERKLK